MRLLTRSNDLSIHLLLLFERVAVAVAVAVMMKASLDSVVEMNSSSLKGFDLGRFRRKKISDMCLSVRTVSRGAKNIRIAFNIKKSLKIQKILKFRRDQ